MKKPAAPSGKESTRAAREKRLAEALRANLRRRKGAAQVEPAKRPVNKSSGSAKRGSDSGKDQN